MHTHAHTNKQTNKQTHEAYQWGRDAGWSHGAVWRRPCRLLDLHGLQLLALLVDGRLELLRHANTLLLHGVQSTKFKVHADVSSSSRSSLHNLCTFNHSVACTLNFDLKQRHAEQVFWGELRLAITGWFRIIGQKYKVQISTPNESPP